MLKIIKQNKYLFKIKIKNYRIKIKEVCLRINFGKKKFKTLL